MKKIYWSVLFISCLGFSQKNIAEIPFNDTKRPLDVLYLPNQDKVVILQGQKTTQVYGNLITDVWAYDTDGFMQKLIADEKLANCIYSPIETAFLIGKVSDKNEFPSEYKLNLDGVPSKYFKITERFRFFNDIYGLDLVNQKDQIKIDLKKDDVYLKVIDLFSGAVNKVKLEKPDISKLENKTTATFTEGLDFEVRINESTISFVTKSINKNYKSATVYRAVYDLTGSKLGDYTYMVDAPKHAMILSDNGGGVSLVSDKEKKVSELAVNNYLVDKNTNEVYVYGLYGNESKELTQTSNVPLGVYVFKFDARGKLIWESHQDIIDIAGFNQQQDVSKIKLSLRLRNEEVLCQVFSKEKSYSNVLTLQKNNGEKKTITNLRIDENQNFKADALIKSDLIQNSFKNFKFDKESLYLSQTSDTFQQYLKARDKSKSLSYKSFISKKGFWVLESDNESYCRLLFF
ncbi:hypothetical protein [Flavobacterium sp.]|uniref:hypothetical protein n=1 Tax=Flavobacterium sp. TaxID=239 RepID=UPI003D0F93B5